jgi:hypothetical protein
MFLLCWLGSMLFHSGSANDLLEVSVFLQSVSIDLNSDRPKLSQLNYKLDRQHKLKLGLLG